MKNPEVMAICNQKEKTQKEIAEEEDVSQVAITNRIKRIREKFLRTLREGD